MFPSFVTIIVASLIPIATFGLSFHQLQQQQYPSFLHTKSTSCNKNNACRNSNSIFTNSSSSHTSSTAITAVTTSLNGDTSIDSTSSSNNSSNLSSLHNQQQQRRATKRRRRRIPTPPSKDVNFLLKRTKYLLSLTPASLQQQEQEEQQQQQQDEDSEGSSGQFKRHQKIKIHRHTFHWLIDAWTNSYHPNSTFYAHSLLKQMIALSTSTLSSSSTASSSSSSHIAPNVSSYTKVMNTYSKEGKADSGDKAYKLLQEMTTQLDYSSSTTTSTGNGYLQPNEITYTTVIEAYANSGTQEAAIKAEKICMEMVQNIRKKQQELIQDEQQQQVTLSTDSSDVDVIPLQPTTRSYNAVIQAYSNSGIYNRAQKAEEFIKKMESLHQRNKHHPVNIIQPNTVNYNTLLTTYANSGLTDAAEHTERILKHVMKNPNVISYNACIDAWAKSGHVDSGQKALDLLEEMKENTNNSNVNENSSSSSLEELKPNTRSYNSVMNAFAKSTSKDGPQRAEQILDQMEEYFENGNEDVKPDFFSFATVINAWGRSYQYGKAQRVLNIFRHMIDLYEKGNESVRPNVVIYNAIINACAYTIGDISEQRRAMEIAHSMLQELEKSPYAKADQVTYGTFLKVCENQMPSSDTRRQLVDVVFRKCAKDGQMGKLVVDQLKSILTPEQFEEMVGFSIFDDKKGWKDLPSGWRCNVVEGKKRRRTRLIH